MKKKEIMEIIAPVIKGNELWKSYPFGMTALGENLVEALHQALSMSVVGRSEQLVCDVCGSNDVIEAPHMGKNCNRCHPF
jgi:hypothetical protein